MLMSYEITKDNCNKTKTPDLKLCMLCHIVCSAEKLSLIALHPEWIIDNVIGDSLPSNTMICFQKIDGLQVKNVQN